MGKGAGAGVRARAGTGRLPAIRVFWRMQAAGDSLGQRWRSGWQTGGAGGETESERGTSATRSLKHLIGWATGKGSGPQGGVPPTGAVDVIRFRGRRIGTGADGEPIVIPVRELERKRVHVSTKENPRTAWEKIKVTDFRAVPTKKVLR